MPTTSGRTKASTRKAAATTTSKKTTTKKSTAPTAKKTTTASTTRKTTTQTKSADRIGTLEEKVDKLLSILDTEFRSELRQGPRSVSNKLRNAGLIK